MIFGTRTFSKRCCAIFSRCYSTDITLDGWISRWEGGKAPWHEPVVNKYLIKFWDKLKKQLPEKPLVFVPLCGKSLDLKWLSDKGCEVVGVEISEKAVKEFFQDHDIIYKNSVISDFLEHKSHDENITLYVGDFYQFNKLDHKSFDFIWDRGSLAAINLGDRERYMSLMTSLTKQGGLHLLESFSYPREEFGGPPQSMFDEEEAALFTSYSVESLHYADLTKDPEMVERLKEFGITSAFQKISLYTKS